MFRTADDGTFFQLGYVTRDLDRAIDLFRDRYGLSRILRFGTPSGMDVAMAYRGDVMIELIQPVVGKEGVYIDALRADGGVRLHHLGYIVKDVAKWTEIVEQYQSDGIAVEHRDTGAGSLLAYADTREDLGYFNEYICITDERGHDLFARTPRN